jgi:cytochrome c oxidase subunit 3
MRLFLVSLSMLFAASLAGYLIVRLRARDWSPPGMPPLPRGLWLSTLLVLACSAAMQGALRAIRGDDGRGLFRRTVLTLLLAVGFLVVQVHNWRFLALAELGAGKNLYAFTFFMLTGLHALHVFGGIVALAWVGVQARRLQYTASGHAAVRHTATYWHFLAVVWLVLFAVLQLST